MTIKEIASIAHVSPATVSRVLNHSAPVKEETRKRIEQVIAEHHYLPNEFARSLSNKRSSTIGVIVPDICNPFFSEVIRGISSVADRSGMQIILCNSADDEKKEADFLTHLQQQRVCGIIITPVSDRDKFNSNFLIELETTGIPVVLLDRDVKGSNFDAVFIDNVKGAFDGVTALLKEGHRDIAVVAGPKTSLPGRDRLLGYRKAFETYRIPVKEALICYGNFHLESGYEITKKLLAMPQRPTAIFACNNMMMVGVLKALLEAHCKVPEDMAVVGFDSIDLLDILGCPISCVARQTDEMGEIAMELLLKRIRLRDQDAENSTVHRVTLHPHLTLKGSEKLIQNGRK